MGKRLKKFDKWEYPVLLTLFFFSVSLLNRGGYIFAAIAALMILYNIRRLQIGLAELMLALFSIFYFIFYIHHFGGGFNEIVCYLLGPWCAYFVGKLYVEGSRHGNALMVIVVVLAAGMCTHGLLNVLAYLRSEHFAAYAYQRIAVDIWRGDVVSVTVTGMYYTFATGISIGVLFSPAKRWSKFAAFITLLLCVAATVFFANRTLLLIVAIIVVFRCLVTLFSRDFSEKARVWILFGGMLLIALVGIVLIYNIGGLKDRLMSLKIFDRLGGSEGGRMEAWAAFFQGRAFLRYPFGGGHIVKNSNVSYLHNLWLDMYNKAGFAACLPFVVFTVIMVARYFDFRRLMLRNGRIVTAVCFQCLLIAIGLNCMVEPIMEANPYYLLIVLMYLGAMNGQICKLRYEDV